MRATEPTLIRLWSDVVAYAKQKCEAYGLDAGEVDDIVIDAYEKARMKLRDTKVRKDRKAAIKSIAWSEVLNELKRRNTARERILREAVRLDATVRVEKVGGGWSRKEEMQGLDVTDGHAVVPFAKDWVQMTRTQIGRERNDCRRVVTQLLKKDMTYEKARRITKLSTGGLYAILKKLREHFDQCFQVYLECQARYFEAKFGIRLVNTSEGHVGGEVPSQEPRNR